LGNPQLATPSVKDKDKAKAKAKAKDKPNKKADKKGKGKGKGKKSKALTRAEQSDRHTLYQLSVQSPEADIEFFTARYEELRGRSPSVLREDFCGTAFLSGTWVASADDRRAVGVDLDEPTLQWGREHNLASLTDEQRDRVDLRNVNVLEGGGEPADITCAMNFSYGVFKTRAELRRYLEVVHEQLAEDGVFITELYGGTEAVVEVLDDREIEDEDGEVDDFTYIWEQAEYNPITHETVCHIHFEFPDGSKIDKAFSYDWRLWTIAELRELLYEVGFTSTRVFWEETDRGGEVGGQGAPEVIARLVYRADVERYTLFES
jgi:SAM-dependent methyltransferase